MNLYAGFLTHLVLTAVAVVPGLSIAYLMARWAPVHAPVKVWILRLALAVCLVSLVVGGVPIAVRAGTEGQAPASLLALSALIGIYLAGVLCRLGDLRQALAAVRRIRGRARLASPEIQAETRALRNDVGVPSLPTVVESDAVDSVVLLAGRPLAIVLPASGFPDETRRLAIAHEMAHIRHRDLAWSAVASVAEAVFWFHPLVLLASGRLRIAQEAFADQVALAATSANPRRYAEMLVELATDRRRVPMVAASAASVREELHARLTALYDRPRKWSVLLVAPAMVLLVPLRPVPVQSGRVIAVTSRAVPVAAPVRRMVSPASLAR